MDIKKIDGTVIFESGHSTFKACILEAIKAGAYLIDADLRGVNLSGAYLRGAYLNDASLSDANLSD